MLGKLHCKFEIINEQRYDLSNHIVWALERRPGGSKKFSHLLGDEFDKAYKSAFKKIGLSDTLILKIRKL